MQVRNILLTGDDGFNSIGTRILIHYLKNRFSLTIAGTKRQQSGIGGTLTLNRNLKWEEIQVDGVKGVCVDGTSADVMEFAYAYYKNPFDLVISGVNLGANIGGSFFSSGTIGAATRALILGITRHALVFSLLINSKYWFKDHIYDEDISPYIKYPGKQANEIVGLAIKNKMWGSAMLNINFPEKPSSRIRFAKPIPDIKMFYAYPGHIDRKKRTFSTLSGLSDQAPGQEYDGGVIINGDISITPCKSDMLDDKAYSKTKDTVIELPH